MEGLLLQSVATGDGIGKVAARWRARAAEAVRLLTLKVVYAQLLTPYANVQKPHDVDAALCSALVLSRLAAAREFLSKASRVKRCPGSH